MPSASGLAAGFTAGRVFEFYVKFTTTTDLPNESGSAGARDATMSPLLWGEDDRGIRIAAPFIVIDRTQGEFAGGRWVFASFEGSIEPKTVAKLVDVALQGVSEFRVAAEFACYRAGEIPVLVATLRRPKGDNANFGSSCAAQIVRDSGEQVQKIRIDWKGDGRDLSATVAMDRSVASSLTPGLYRIRATAGSGDSAIAHLNGFWVYDEKLLAAGTPLVAGTQFFTRGGEPYPVTGTTYMASNIQRKFLFEPNPAVWDRDFRQMKESGVNMIRTGIWTGWRSYALDNGAPTEQTLRSMDAFVHTARKYDIPVIFTLFAFVPEMWNGVNPYLDPRAVSAQKQFVGAFAQRFAAVNDLLWDFINEPSFCSPTHLWSCRPNYDSYESSAWISWLDEHYKSIPSGEREARIREFFRASADESIGLPSMEDFDDVNIIETRHPVKTMDYRLFTQEMFAQWVGEMKSAVRANGNSRQLVTVGQDEAGNGDSPSPHFFGEKLDFTSMHNWWANDDLLWDSVVSTTSPAPNLIEETGVMFYEKIDGRAWRTEEEARDLLERKFAIALGARGAGFLQWIWNINAFMNSDNEVSIGFYRVDGTAKPELDPFLRYAKFIAANAKSFRDPVPAEALMVIPQSQLFSTRNFAADAMHRCVRVMSYTHGIPLRSASEYTLAKESQRPKLVVVPSPRILTAEAWARLMEWVEEGSILLVSGVIDEDEHWLPAARSAALGVASSIAPVAAEESLSIGGKTARLSFRGEKIQRVEKAVVAGQTAAQVVVAAKGKGAVVWSPLPVELSDSVEAAEELYRFALERAGVVPMFEAKGKDDAILVLPTRFADATLYAFVSESDSPASLDVVDKRSGAAFHIELKARRSALAVIGANGTIVDTLE